MEKSVLLRFKDKDALNGISKETFNQMVEVSGISGNSLIHLGLVELVQRYLPDVYRDIVNGIEEQQEDETSPHSNQPDIIISNTPAFRRQSLLSKN